MRVAVLFEAPCPAARVDERDVEAQVRAVSAALVDRGACVTPLPVTLDLDATRRALARLEPDLCFNLVESLGRMARLIHVVPALLEGLGVAFTGAGAAAMLLSSSKLLTKRCLRDAGLPTPDWIEASPEPPTASPSAAVEPGTYLIKPVWEDASVGIDDSALVRVRTLAELTEAVRARAALLGTEVFAERFIEGRELNLSLLASPGGVAVLPPAEILFEEFPPGKPRLVGYAAKWDSDSFEYTHTPRTFEMREDDAPLLCELARIARQCFAQLGLRGYGRVDFRVDRHGLPWVLEVNANPCLSPDAGFAAAAERAGLDHREVVARICADSH